MEISLVLWDDIKGQEKEFKVFKLLDHLLLLLKEVENNRRFGREGIVATDLW